MKKVTNIFEDRAGGALIVREDGSAERMTRAEFKERAEERGSREWCKRIADELEDLASGAGRRYGLTREFRENGII